MTKVLIAVLALAVSLSAFADEAAKPTDAADNQDLKTLPEVESQDQDNSNSLSSTLERGMDNRGLTMEEKWDKDTMVCKRMPTSGSRLGRKVCHSRAEWQAMRENARETTRAVQRRDMGLDND